MLLIAGKWQLYSCESVTKCDNLHITLPYYIFSDILLIQVKFIYFFIKTFAQWGRLFSYVCTVLFSNFNFAQIKGFKVFIRFFIKYKFCLRNRKANWCSFPLLNHLSFLTCLFILFFDSQYLYMYEYSYIWTPFHSNFFQILK